MTTQPQLLGVSLAPKDVVYTPDWIARDMVDFFKPSGRILEPSAGDGVFLRHLPENTEWCEIERGVDFFNYTSPVDWCFGNPPYSMFTDWMYHSMDIADNICYLIPCNKTFNSYVMVENVMNWGGVVHMRLYAPGRKIGFPVGYAIGAVWFQKGYKGAMGISVYEVQS